MKGAPPPLPSQKKIKITVNRIIIFKDRPGLGAEPARTESGAGTPTAVDESGAEGIERSTWSTFRRTRRWTLAVYSRSLLILCVATPLGGGAGGKILTGSRRSISRRGDKLQVVSQRMDLTAGYHLCNARGGAPYWVKRRR